MALSQVCYLATLLAAFQTSRGQIEPPQPPGGANLLALGGCPITATLCVRTCCDPGTTTQCVSTHHASLRRYQLRHAPTHTHTHYTTGHRGTRARTHATMLHTLARQHVALPPGNHGAAKKRRCNAGGPAPPSKLRRVARPGKATCLAPARPDGLGAAAAADNVQRPVELALAYQQQLAVQKAQLETIIKDHDLSEQMRMVSKVVQNMRESNARPLQVTMYLSMLVELKRRYVPHVADAAGTTARLLHDHGGTGSSSSSSTNHELQMFMKLLDKADAPGKCRDMHRQFHVLACKAKAELVQMQGLSGAADEIQKSECFKKNILYAHARDLLRNHYLHLAAAVSARPALPAPPATTPITFQALSPPLPGDDARGPNSAGVDAGAEVAWIQQLVRNSCPGAVVTSLEKVVAPHLYVLFVRTTRYGRAAGHACGSL